MSLVRIEQIENREMQEELYTKYVMAIVSNLHCSVDEAHNLMERFPTIDVANAVVKNIDQDNTWIDASPAEQVEIMELQKAIKNLRKPL